MPDDTDSRPWQAKMNLTPMTEVAERFNIPIDTLRSAIADCTARLELSDNLADNIERFMAIAAELENRQMLNQPPIPHTCN